MGHPVLIGAGLGGAISLAMGQSPVKGALLGGATGGAFGGAGGFGSGFSGLHGTATTPVSMATGGYASGIGGQVIPNVAPNVAPALAATQTATPANIVGKFPNFNTAAPVDDLASARQLMGGYEYGKPFYPDETIQSLNQRALFAKNPNFTPLQVTPVDATKGTPVESTKGGYDLTANKPLYERAFDSVLNYAQTNPLDVAGFGLFAAGKFGRKMPPPPPPTGGIIKGTAPQLAQMLQVRRPTRFS